MPLGRFRSRTRATLLLRPPLPLLRPRLTPNAWLALLGLLLLGLPLSAGPQVPAQTPSSAPASSQPFKTSATAIDVDVVVRDGKGEPVLDLTPADFELYENDVRQQIGNVSLVAPGGSAAKNATPSAAAPTQAASAPNAAHNAAPNSATNAAHNAAPSSAPNVANNAAQPTVLALVFHRLSPEARALTHQAALAYVNTPARADDFAGVFHIDQSLDTIQRYTSDRERVRKAIDEVSTHPSSAYGRTLASPIGTGGGDRDPNVSPTQGAESPGSPDLGLVPRTNAQDIVTLKLTQMYERMEEQYQVLMRDQQGQTTMNALLALVDSMSTLPGRKSIVLFAEGLSMPSDVQHRVQELVSAANRANVSIYTMDAAGLRVQSEQAATSRSITRLGFAGVGDVVEGDVDTPSNGAMTARLERNEFILRQDPKASLGFLAKETGGFLIDNTNDLARAFARIDSDRRFHYLLTYSPANTAQDGTWHRITVKVRRPNVEVRARGGYYAMPAPGTFPTLPFETAALAALDTHPRPTAIPVRAGVFQFPDPAHPGRVALMIAISESDVGHLVDATRTSFRTDFTILARLRDARGTVVRKGSLPYQLTGPADGVERARQRQVLFNRQPTLPPGRYTLEYAVHDALTGRAGAGAEPIEIPSASGDEPAVSSLVIVQRAEQVPAANRDAGNPLYSGDVLLYPNLGEPLHKAPDGTPQTLTFFYTVYARQTAGPATLTSTLTLQNAGRTLATVPLTLPAPDASGRIQHLARLPLSSIPPGTYDLQVTIADDATHATRTASFTLLP